MYSRGRTPQVKTGRGFFVRRRGFCSFLSEKSLKQRAAMTRCIIGGAGGVHWNTSECRALRFVELQAREADMGIWRKIMRLFYIMTAQEACMRAHWAPLNFDPPHDTKRQWKADGKAAFIATPEEIACWRYHALIEIWRDLDGIAWAG